MENVQKNESAGSKGKIERVTGLGRRTREEIAKWNPMTALGFQTGGDIRHPQPLFGGYIQNIDLKNVTSISLVVLLGTVIITILFFQTGAKWLRTKP